MENIKWPEELIKEVLESIEGKEILLNNIRHRKTDGLNIS